MSYAAFVINLDGSEARMDLMVSTLDAQGIPFVRVSAIDGRSMSPSDLPGYDHGRSRRYYGRALNGAEVACSLSHLKALRHFLDSDAEVGIIFEDDVELEDDFRAAFETTIHDLSEAEPNWGLLHMYPRKRRYNTRVGKVSPRQIYHLHKFPVGAGAIAYSREGAGLTLRDGASIYAPWDVYLKDVIVRHDMGYGIVPHLVTLRGLESDITPMSGSRGEITGAAGWFRKQRRSLRHEAVGAAHWLRRSMRRQM